MREHTVVIQPPRALWVPFELGRPLGAPGDAAFQSRVLRHVLQLLEAPRGPVLADFPDDAPVCTESPATLVCPVNFAVPSTELSATNRMQETLQQEIGQLHSWYDLAVNQRGRTTMGVSGLTPEELGLFVSAFLEGEIPENPRPDIPLAALFRFAVEDLKSYYCEAITAQPGQQAVSSEALADWFWRSTTAGRVLFAVYEACKHSAIPGMQVVTAGLLIPRSRASESPYATV